MHTSPLATPGVGDAGGLNVYVAEVARRLGERGMKVDVFTRPTDPAAGRRRGERAHPGDPPARPDRSSAVARRAAGLVDDFAAASWTPHVGDHHAPLPLLAVRHGRPELAVGTGFRWCTPCTRWPRSRTQLRGDAATEPDVRERGEAAIVAAAGRLTANTADEAAELEQHYGARPEQITIVPPGVDLHTFHPCDQPKSRAQLGVPQDAQVILFVGRIQPLKAPDMLIKAVAELARRATRAARSGCG